MFSLRRQQAQTAERIFRFALGLPSDFLPLAFQLVFLPLAFRFPFLRLAQARLLHLSSLSLLFARDLLDSRAA